MNARTVLRLIRPRPAALLAVAAISLGLTMGTVLSGCKRALITPTEEVPPDRIRVIADVPPDRSPSNGQTRVLGNGWYANVEVDSDDRIHLAWTDADVGDVMYTTIEPGPPKPVVAEIVADEGAAGSYVRLALAPGGAPVISYYHQDLRMLRLAHRPADLPKMSASGAELAVAGLDGASAAWKEPTALVPGEKPPPPPEHGMGPGWHGEDVAFGDNAGIAGALTVDRKGRPHAIYYTKDERLRYAHRPDGLPAFGAGGHGAFDKADIDDRAGGSYTMSTDLLALSDGTIVASYCHWNFFDAQLKLAVRKAGSSTFQVVAASPMRKLVDGWHSTLLPRSDGKVDAFSVATGEGQLLLGQFDPTAPAELGSRQVIMERPGATVVQKAADGTLWVLSRGLGLPSLDEQPGVWLIELPQGDRALSRRFMLEKGVGQDPWIDLALKKDGTPVAVWTSRETLSMRMYTHKR